MDASNELKQVIAETRDVHLIKDDIYSVLPDCSRTHHYDRRATVYDLVVSTRYLNALYATGEFVRPRSKFELKEMLDRTFSRGVSYRVKGNMALATTAMSL